MKIIHFIPSIDKTSGGTGVYMQLLSKSLGEITNLTIVTCPTNNPVKIENSEIIYLSSTWKETASFKKEWTLILDKIKPELVHINCCWQPESSLIQKWSKQLNYKTVLTPHGMLEPWIISRNYWLKKLPALLFYQKNAVKNATLIHATAETEKLNLIKLGYNDNIEVIPNGIDIGEITIKSSWKISKNILFLSRVHEKKGIEIFMDSLATIKSKLSGYKVIIAGEGDPKYLKALKLRAFSLNLDQIIIFKGGVYGSEKWLLFQEADFFVLPTYSENFGIVVAEALAAGTPVITTTGTPWAELDKEKCGWCIDLNVTNLSSTLENAISKTAPEFKQMGVNGRRLVEKKYEISTIAKKIKNLYLNITSH